MSKQFSDEQMMEMNKVAEHVREKYPDFFTKSNTVAVQEQFEAIPVSGCSEKENRKKKLLDEIEDLVSNFLYYDRQEDEDLPVGVIEDMVKNQEITLGEIVDHFGYTMAVKLREESHDSK